MSSNSTEQLTIRALTRIQAEKVYVFLANEFPKREFRYLLANYNDTSYAYHVYIYGKSNAEIRAFANGAITATRAILR